MNALCRLFCSLAACFGLTASALADTFAYSYSVDAHTASITVNGTFDGVQSGNFVTGISNLTMEFSNGSQIFGPVTIGHFDETANNYVNSGSYVMSFDIFQSDFLIFAASGAHGARFMLRPTRGVASVEYQFPTYYYQEQMNQPSWSLVNTTPHAVPDTGLTLTFTVLAAAWLIWFRRSQPVPVRVRVRVK